MHNSTFDFLWWHLCSLSQSPEAMNCQAEILEMTLVSSRFSDKQKETTLFPVVPKRNNTQAQLTHHQ